MAESKPSASPIDHVRRDSRDSAYHCPQCDTPFTRRSNLRRHYQIHMRSAVFKCEKCTDEFSTKEEVQGHSLTCFSNTDSPLDWSSSHDDRTSQRMTMQQPYHTKSHSYPNHHNSMAQHNVVGHGTYIPPPVVPSANFEPAETHYTGHYAQSNYGHTHSHLHSSPSVMSTSSGLPASFDGNFIHPSSPPSSYSHRRPSISSSISSSSTSSSPYQHALAHAQGAGCICPACVNGGRALERTPWHGMPAVPASPTPTLDEPAVYTRRQVKDMIDVVSDCLIETMGDVLTRPQGNTEPPNGHLIRSIRDDGFRRTVLSEALPRVYYRIHGGDHRQ